MAPAVGPCGWGMGDWDVSLEQPCAAGAGCGHGSAGGLCMVMLLNACVWQPRGRARKKQTGDRMDGADGR